MILSSCAIYLDRDSYVGEKMVNIIEISNLRCPCRHGGGASLLYTAARASSLVWGSSAAARQHPPLVAAPVPACCFDSGRSVSPVRERRVLRRPML